MEDLLSLIRKGEGLRVEFKQTISSPKKAAREISAFANTQGGYLFVGIADDKKLVSIGSLKKEKEALLAAAGFFCSPPIALDMKSVLLGDKLILIARINEGGEKPYQCLSESGEERIYIRMRDKNLLASRDVVRSLREEAFQKKKKKGLEKNEKKLLTYLTKNERITLREFKRQANLSKRRASKILFQLVKTGLIRNHTLEKENYYTASFE
jgi:predicted HTH transcriptional regulator